MSAQLEDRIENFERRVNERFDDLEERVSLLEVDRDSSSIEVTTPDSESYVGQVNPETHVERATTIANYLIHEEDVDPVTAEDIEEAYIDLRIPKPANMSDILAKAEGRDWMMRTGKEGQTVLWTISKPGIEAVDRGFTEE